MYGFIFVWLCLLVTVRLLSSTCVFFEVLCKCEVPHSDFGCVHTIHVGQGRCLRAWWASVNTQAEFSLVALPGSGKQVRSEWAAAGVTVSVGS